ncbi:ABC transporter ATP-binding protein [Halobaculum lipolyticum]|uniref:ABC transporter ATP-binding protein n=1 Tax=Halobaculum lipolyticum TaxID=3032001 RepID=A0ABD5WB98_9EURY|nr:ABC transporter ATP-binding protein [Halobaculum sp. DT31]
MTVGTGEAAASGAEGNGRAVGDGDAVVVDGLRKRFGSGPDAVTAVDGVSLRVERGSVVGLLGPNGAGKTTLIKCVLGMVLPDEGSVELLGTDVASDPRAAYGRVDAMLEGARNDYWRLTVRENLRYFTTIGGVDPDSVADRHDRLLRRLGLADRADTPVRELSRGMKQKVSLASVLAGGAEVVFLDEPTLGLDVESSRTLQRELRRLAEEEDLTVVLSSHDMDVIETVCDRVVIVSDGRVVADDTVDRLLRTDAVSAVRVTSPDLDADLVDAVGDRFEVTDVDPLDEGARIEVAVDGAGLYDLFAFLRSREVRLHGVRTVEPDLEDVFVSLTGIEDGGGGDGGSDSAGHESDSAGDEPDRGPRTRRGADR